MGCQGELRLGQLSTLPITIATELAPRQVGHLTGLVKHASGFLDELDDKASVTIQDSGRLRLRQRGRRLLLKSHDEVLAAAALPRLSDRVQLFVPHC